ncbi:putative WRKY transcription factor 3 [Castanea sativa]|uniref:putative WRKY transcription factor 3 n=1 Tax=Castanea sativa TaxID=21020 RepID=UPI003F64BDC6
MGKREEQPQPPSTTSFSSSTSSSSLPLKLTASYSSSSSSSLLRPTITLPPRTSMETIFNGGGGGGGGGGNSSGSGLGLSGLGFSPGPMTLVSSFFNDNDDCKSFSQLLAGAMTSPAAQRPSLPPPPPPPMAVEDVGGGGGGSGGRGKDDDKSFSGGGGEEEFRFQQNRPTGLAISPLSIFTVPPGLIPAGFLDSLGQGPLGMTHQQALAQVTAQAAQAHTHVHIQADYSSSLSAAPATSLTQLPAFTTNTTAHQQVPPSIPDSGVVNQSSDFSHFDQRSQPSTFAVDNPLNDGYNWRQYGLKQVKGSEFLQSYYKCISLGCPVKKKVERSLDGQVTKTIYKGQHNHELPQKRAKDTGNSNLGNPDFASLVQSGNLNKLKEETGLYLMSKKDQESSQATPKHLSGTTESEVVDDAETGVDEKDEDEPEAERQSTEVRVSEPAFSHRTVTEPRIMVQTTSEVDVLDDGYRWRKYGQKVVKGNPNPRRYYKCTTVGCNVRKHVERASSDPKVVISTYEGKHNHDIPAAKSSSHNTANSIALQSKPDKVLPEKHSLINNMGLGNNEQQPIARLRLKEEQIT